MIPYMTSFDGGGSVRVL
jgi:hypothetical protein